MRRYSLGLCLLFLAAGWLGSARVNAEDRTPTKILADIDAVKMPEVTPEVRRDRAALMKFIESRQKAMTARADLIKELYKVDPDNKKLEELLPERWNAIFAKRDPAASLELVGELNEVLKSDRSDKVKTEAAFFLAIGSLQRAVVDKKTDEAMKEIDAFIKRAPKDDRGGQLLFVTASQVEKSPEKKVKLFKRLLADYPESQFKPQAEEQLVTLEKLGKPFELSFKDAIKGTQISMKDLKGKVVVIDFWATWCGPCVAEMPNMKKLYAEYKDKGVEFIGVSLDAPKDEGGLDKLKEFVADKKIEWPQYYQGNGWESEFSKSWRVSAIPCVFIVDAEGKLYSTDARGQLEELIPELLKKAGAKGGAGAAGN